MASIILRSVEVRYPEVAGPSQRNLSGLLGRGRGRPAAPQREALRRVSLSLGEGDRVGLIGRNGAGKTTLLRTMAGICPPSRGVVQVDGEVLAILNPAAAFDSERTGYENIELAARLIGLDANARSLLTHDVEEFTELGDYLNRPLLTYSSGMMVRLAFAVATGAARDIMLIDEIIAAGDAGFQERAMTRIQALCGRGKILVLASHSHEILSQFVDKAAFLRSGEVVSFGPLDRVWEDYILSMNPHEPETS